MCTKQSSQSAHCTKAYRVDRIPDRECAAHKIRAGGPVDAAIADGFMHIVRQLANIAPDGGLTATVRFMLDRSTDPQANWSVYLVFTSASEDALESAARLLETSPVATFYELSPCNPPKLPFDAPPAACFVVRKEEYLIPSITPESNPHVPPYRYAVIYPFKPRPESDFLQLARLASCNDGPIVIDVVIEPTETSGERAYLTDYVARLREINFSFRRVEDPVRPLVRHASGESGPLPRWSNDMSAEPERDSTADAALGLLEEISKAIHKPHVLFNVRILANNLDFARAAAGLVADAAFDGGQYSLLAFPTDHPISASAVAAATSFCLFTPPTHAHWMNDTEQAAYAPLARIASMATHAEIAGAFRFPIGAPRPLNTFVLDTDPVEADTSEFIVVGHDYSDASGQPPGKCRGIRLNLLSSHLGVLGKPGRGKTTVLMGCIVQINAAGTPVLVIESSKTEYRVLKALKNHPDEALASFGRRLRVYTPGNESVSPMRMNPLEIQPGISQDEAVDNLLNCFEASMTIEGPMQALLPEILDETYEAHTQGNPWPTMRDVRARANDVVNRKMYSGELASNIQAAMELRLGYLCRGELGKVFQCHLSIPSIDDLLSGPAIIELDRLPVTGKCLFVLFLLVRIQQHIRTHPPTKPGPRLVIGIEEAHNIAGADTNAAASEIAANPKTHAAELISRLMAELRGQGVGIIISDQSPHAVARSVLTCTATKIAFQLPEARDRDAIAEAMLMDATQEDHNARLGVGEAYLFTDDYYYPRHIRTRNISNMLGLPDRITDGELRQIIETEEWFLAGNQRRCEVELNALSNALETLKVQCRAFASTVESLQAKALDATATPDTRRENVNQTIRKNARQIRETLKKLLRDFRRTWYERFVPADRDILLCDEVVGDAHAEFEQEYDRVKADFERLDQALANVDVLLAAAM